MRKYSGLPLSDAQHGGSNFLHSPALTNHAGHCPLDLVHHERRRQSQRRRGFSRSHKNTARPCTRCHSPVGKGPTVVKVLLQESIRPTSQNSLEEFATDQRLDCACHALFRCSMSRALASSCGVMKPSPPTSLICQTPNPGQKHTWRGPAGRSHPGQRSCKDLGSCCRSATFPVRRTRARTGGRHVIMTGRGGVRPQTAGFARGMRLHALTK